MIGSHSEWLLGGVHLLTEIALGRCKKRCVIVDSKTVGHQFQVGQ